MEELLIGNEVSSGFFGVFKLFKFDNQNISQLLKVLLHILDPHFPVGFKCHRLELAVNICFELFRLLTCCLLPGVVFILVELGIDVLGIIGL